MRGVIAVSLDHLSSDVDVDSVAVSIESWTVDMETKVFRINVDRVARKRQSL